MYLSTLLRQVFCLFLCLKHPRQLFGRHLLLIGFKHDVEIL